MDELSLEQSIGLLLSQVPKPIHDFVLNELSEKTQQLSDKHKLHVDQAGVLQRELLLMLLGKEEPANFSKSLGEAGIPEATAQALLLDINEEIFKPLRKLEQTPAVPAPAAPAPTYREPIPEPAPAPITPPPPPVAQAPQWTPPYPQTAPPPPQFVPMPPGTYWVPVSIAQVPPPPPPQAPAPEPATPVAPPQPTPEVQPEAPRPEPTPVTQPQWTAPANLPTGMPVTPSAPQIPITKEYGADPYREPV